MSSKIVENFLKEESKKDSEDLVSALYRYKILSHYNLGKKIHWNECDNIDSFPLNDDQGPFRYDCDISDEDFMKVKTIYEKENKKNKRTEKRLSILSIIMLVLGLYFLGVFLFSFIALSEGGYPESYTTLGIGILIFVCSLINWGIIESFIHISKKIDNFMK